MQISANNLLQAAQQAFAKPAPRQAAAQPFEPENFAPETSEATAPASQGAYQRPGSQIDIKV